MNRRPILALALAALLGGTGTYAAEWTPPKGDRAVSAALEGCWTRALWAEKAARRRADPLVEWDMMVCFAGGKLSQTISGNVGGASADGAFARGVPSVEVLPGTYRLANGRALMEFRSDNLSFLSLGWVSCNVRFKSATHLVLRQCVGKAVTGADHSQQQVEDSDFDLVASQ